jgi:hypothetical protein
VRHRAVLPLAIAAAVLLVACGEKAKEPKVDAKKEQEEALERSRHGAFGADVQALDKAKALGGQMNDMAAKNLENADPK